MDIIKKTEFRAMSFKKSVQAICRNATVEEDIVHNVQFNGARVTDMTDIGRVSMLDIVSTACSWHGMCERTRKSDITTMMGLVVGKPATDCIKSLVIHYDEDTTIYKLAITVGEPSILEDHGHCRTTVNMENREYSIYVYEQEYALSDEFNAVLDQKIDEICKSATDYKDVPYPKYDTQIVIDFEGANGKQSLDFTCGMALDTEHRYTRYNFIAMHARLQCISENGKMAMLVTTDDKYRSAGLLWPDDAHKATPHSRVKALLSAMIRALVLKAALVDAVSWTGFNPNGEWTTDLDGNPLDTEECIAQDSGD